MGSATASSRWLFGPVTDLTLGCGLGYVVLVVLLLVPGGTFAGIGAAAGLVPLLAGTPHSGATLLRVYEKRSDRRAYVVFSVWVTLLLLACFVAGLYLPAFGSLLLSLSITWGPYHYSAQNYGIAVMFLGRRGVALTPAAKRALQLSFTLSFVLTFLGIHGAVDGGQYGTVGSYRGSVFQDLKLGIPSPWWQSAFVLVGVAYLGSLAVVGRSLVGRARFSDLLPSALLVATQASWFTLPPLARHMGWIQGDLALATAFVWVAAGHTVQYLWITTYYAAHAGGYGARFAFYGKSLLAGMLVFTAPALAYALTLEGTALGGVAFGADVGIYCVAIVNLHHFVLDGAVWKLRDGRVARVLIRREAAAEVAEPAGRGWLAPAVYGLAALAIGATLFGTWERRTHLEPALERRDLAALETSLARLDQAFQVNAGDYAAAGRAALAVGDPERARAFFRRAVAERRIAAYWVRLGRLERSLGSPAAAREAFEEALAINPSHRQAWIELASQWLADGEPARALETLERADAALVDDPEIDALSARARALL
ncbi:MAG: tetratricopeptide repeat protein [Myxococcota bacterium]